MPPKPSEKRSRVSSSEEENHVLGVGDAILVDIKRRLEKLDLLDKIDERLVKMEDDMGTIKQKVLKLEGGLNSVTGEVADLKESIEKKAEKEHRQLLEEEVEDLRNRSRRNNLVFYKIPERAEGQNCAESITGTLSVSAQTLRRKRKTNERRFCPTRNTDRQKSLYCLPCYPKVY